MELCEKLKLIRKMNGLTLEQVCTQLGGIVTKQAISKYEKGMMRPSQAVLEALLKVYHVSYNSLEFQTKIDVSQWHFRRPESMSFQQEEALKGEIKFHLGYYLSVESLLVAQIPFSNPLKENVDCNNENIEHLAQLLREIWKLGNDSLSSVCRILELHGIKVLEMEWNESIDGLCGWANDEIPFIILRKDVTTERKRFTALHELAHLLFPSLEKNDPRTRERLCHRFASSLLMPLNIIEVYIGKKRQKLAMDELISLRNSYGMSIAAIVHRLKDLAVITEEYYNYIFDYYINKNKMETGWGKYPLSDEASRYERLLQRALSEGLLTPEEISERTGNQLCKKIDQIEWL